MTDTVSTPDGAEEVQRLVWEFVQQRLQVSPADVIVLQDACLGSVARQYARSRLTALPWRRICEADQALRLAACRLRRLHSPVCGDSPACRFAATPQPAGLRRLPSPVCDSPACRRCQMRANTAHADPSGSLPLPEGDCQRLDRALHVAASAKRPPPPPPPPPCTTAAGWRAGPPSWTASGGVDERTRTRSIRVATEESRLVHLLQDGEQVLPVGLPVELLHAAAADERRIQRAEVVACGGGKLTMQSLLDSIFDSVWLPASRPTSR